MPLIMHVDMDAFYASVEIRDNPSLRGKPVIVGHNSRRGVVLTANYEVRPFGVRSGMSIQQAIALAPQSIIVPPRFAAYHDASQVLFSVLRTISPLVEGLSLDEAFVDITGSLTMFGDSDGTRIAARVQQMIVEQTEGLTASVGLASSKFVAKIATDLKKPNGCTRCPPGGERAFLAPLDIGKMLGIGTKTAAMFRQRGYQTIGDLQRASIESLGAIVGIDHSAHLRDLALGIDARAVTPDREAKSIGSENTFEQDVRDFDTLLRSLLGHAEDVARRLRASGLAAGSLTVKARWPNRKLVTKQAAFDHPAVEATEILRLAKVLLKQMCDEQRTAFRLIGLAAHKLVAIDAAGPRQMSLLAEDREAGVSKTALGLGKALDALEAKFGKGVVRHGR